MNLSLNQNVNFSNQRIFDSAVSWVGTAFKKHGRIKNVGVDCVGLILGILEEINHPVRSEIKDDNSYNFDEFEEILTDILNRHFKIRNELVTPSIGLFEYPGGYQHLGIILELEEKDYVIIHADILARKVVLHRLDSVMKKRIKAVFEI